MSMFDELMSHDKGAAVQQATSQVSVGSCEAPSGNAAAGRWLIRGFARRAEVFSRRAPPRGYDPVARYDEVWSRGHAQALTKMHGYRVGRHRGVVAELSDWQPNLRFFDLVVLNSSAGKDSMAAMEAVTAAAQAVGLKDRLVVVHSDLGRMEHPEVGELAADQARLLGLPFHVVRREVRGVRKDLFDRFIDNMQIRVLIRPVRLTQARRRTLLGAGFVQEGVRWRARLEHPRQLPDVEALLTLLEMSPTTARSPQEGEYRIFAGQGFPGFGTRYCTSEFKTSEISKWVTAWTKAHQAKFRGRPARVLQVLGLRAEESEKRAKKGFEWKKKPTSNQHVYQWLPIQALSTTQVWDMIAASPMRHHPAYDVGFKRLSCRLCPLAGDSDIALAALVYPQIADEVVAIEERFGFKFKEKRSLKEIRRAAQANSHLIRTAAAARQRLAADLDAERTLGSLAILGRQRARQLRLPRCPVHG